MGYPKGEIPMLDVHGQEVAGATFDVPIWHAYMAAALKNQPALKFVLPNKYPVFKPFTGSYFGPLAYAATTTTSTDTTPVSKAPSRLENAPH
jgi:membrane carboxypeptidase/penicillin-binding protein